MSPEYPATGAAPSPLRSRTCRLGVAALVAASALAGCGAAIDRLTATHSAAPLAQPVEPLASVYRLAAGDELRVRVFGEPDLSGDFVVNSAGAVDLPLIGEVAAAGAPVSEFQQRVIERFKDGYLRDPKLSVEVLNYRPFFILGEVKNAGEYDYKSSLTVQDAVAIAGGYTYRAKAETAYIRRAGADHEQPFDLSQRVPVYPGDIIRIPERFF